MDAAVSALWLITWVSLLSKAPSVAREFATDERAPSIIAIADVAPAAVLTSTVLMYAAVDETSAAAPV